MVDSPPGAHGINFFHRLAQIFWYDGGRGKRRWTSVFHHNDTTTQRLFRPRISRMARIRRGGVHHPDQNYLSRGIREHKDTPNAATNNKQRATTIFLPQRDEGTKVEGIFPPRRRRRWAEGGDGRNIYHPDHNYLSRGHRDKL